MVFMKARRESKVISTWLLKKLAKNMFFFSKNNTIHLVILKIESNHPIKIQCTALSTTTSAWDVSNVSNSRQNAIKMEMLTRLMSGMFLARHLRSIKLQGLRNKSDFFTQQLET